MSGKLSKVDLARIELWTACDMVFVVKDRGRYPVTIPQFTACHKPRYTRKIKEQCNRYDTKWRDDHGPPRAPDDRVVCVVLQGQERFVWRSDVLTEAEYAEAREADRATLAGLL
jgi:formylglycine-generating enzyme required for sulfatase activity